jgi:hypothetical protein
VLYAKYEWCGIFVKGKGEIVIGVGVVGLFMVKKR